MDCWSRLEKGEKSVFVTSFLVHETLTHLSKLPTAVEPDWPESLVELARGLQSDQNILDIAESGVRALVTTLFVGGYKGRAGRDLLITRHYSKATEGLLFFFKERQSSNEIWHICRDKISIGEPHYGPLVRVAVF